MESYLVEALTYFLFFALFPILIFLLVGLACYIKGKKKFEDEMNKKDKKWNEYEDIDMWNI